MKCTGDITSEGFRNGSADSVNGFHQRAQLKISLASLDVSVRAFVNSGFRGDDRLFLLAA